jgi:RNA polymerase sigma factor (sigma-70 family)
LGRRIRISEEELIRLLTERSERGLEILYDNYSAALYGVIFRLVQQDDVAEDILQETFIRIWKNFIQYKAEKGRLFTWMVQVARNLSLDKLRSKEFQNAGKNQDIGKAVFSGDPALSGSYNPETIGVREIVSRLEKEYKEVIELLYFQGFSQAQAADKLNIPLGTVKTRSRAAILKLRQSFDAVVQN